MGVLICKDLWLNKKGLLAYLGGFVYWIIMAVCLSAVGKEAQQLQTQLPALASLIWSVLPMFSVYNMFTELVRIDENRLWAQFIISSPALARGQVREKYLLWLLLCSVNLFLTVVTDSVACLITGSEISVLGAVLLMTLCCTLLTALDLPLMFRFGTAIGSNLRVGFMLALLAAAGIYGLFGDLSIFGDPAAIWLRIADLLENGTESKPLIALMVLLPYITGAVFFISYKISVKVYTRGVEEYE